MYSSEFCEPNH